MVIPNLIVPVLNRYDLLQRMLDSVDYPVEHLLVIDNGASTVEQAFDLHVPACVEHTTYLPMPANLGVSGSWNLGIKSFPYADRWFIVSNDVQFHPGALERLCEARRDEITVSEMIPHWQAFALGYDAVKRVGLFDEGFFPAFCEDNDMSRRAEHAGVTIRRVDVPMIHDNSSTINSDRNLLEKNSRTFPTNVAYFHDKVAREDYSAGEWDVYRRRMNGWEVDR